MAGQSNAKLEQLRSENQSALTELVFAELSLGLTFCSIAKTSNDDLNRQRRSLIVARRAYAIAERYMFKVKMDHPAFDQMTAQAELLRLELERLGH